MIRRAFSDYTDLTNQGIFLQSSYEFTNDFQAMPFSAAEIGEPIIKTILKEHFKTSPYPSK